MKKQTLAVLVLTGLIHAGSAKASGCGSPMYVPVGVSRVLMHAPFRNQVQSFDAFLTTSLHSPTELRLDLYSELLPVKGVASYFWHRMELVTREASSVAVPAQFSLPALESALGAPSTEIELVDDAFVDSDCGGQASNREKNLRVRVIVGADQLEFRTSYVPND